MRRLWHRLFGHPKLTYAGESDGNKMEFYFCLQCSGWVEIDRTGYRHIRIVERGHKL